MKTVVIFTRTIDPDGYPFNDEYHWNAYFDLLLALKSRGVQAYFATGLNTYLGEGRFSEAFTADAKVSVEELTRVPQVKADLVFEKGGFTADDVPVLNPPLVRQITASKAETYKNFSKYQPKSFICADRAAVEWAFADTPGELIVVKEPESNGGRAVLIGPKAQILQQAPQTYPLIVQEFMDTSVGVPGFVEGIHDVRVKIGGGRVFGGMIRKPAPGEYKANLAQGGTAVHLKPMDLPPEALELALEIDCFFEKYPRYYALDFANTPQGWKLIELNSKPGLSPGDVSPEAKLIIDELADYLVELASK
ncbi:MAG: hypothetical protein NVSMB39_2770 [Candidatus Saccharimonadales bacterium]